MLSLRDKLAIAAASLLLMLLMAAVLVVLAFALTFRFGLSRFGVLLLCISAMGCAKQLPVIPVMPLEEIHLGASIGNHVILCVENPDIDLATKPRWVCLSMDMVRRWFAVARVAD